MFQCNQVGLTENIKGDKKKFELWLRGREEVYIVQVCGSVGITLGKRGLMHLCKVSSQI